MGDLWPGRPEIRLRMSAWVCGKRTISVTLCALYEPNLRNCVISTHLFMPFFPKSVTFRYTCSLGNCNP
jgi:hypothetical protein